MSKYKFKSKSDYRFFVPELTGKYLITDYFICNYGYCTIANGYAWDGCTFAFDTKETYTASMVHDALYQYGKRLGLKRKVADRHFLHLMKNFIFRRIYYLSVRLFGWIFY